jgi:O-antigen ligase
MRALFLGLGGKWTRGASRCTPGLLGLVTALVLLWTGSRLESHGANQRQGATDGALPSAKHSSPLWGVNVNLEQYSEESLARVLESVAAAGLQRVRQEFPWSQIEPASGQFRWERWDRIVSAVEAHNLEIVAVLNTTPLWACAGQGPHTPPSREADFGVFARAVAARYGERIDHYQIWDEPNLSSHWGDRYVDATGYARLLRTGASQIRAVDPGALILTAGLAPTWEQGPLNLDEAAFLQGLYEAGAEDVFDVVTAKPYGFWSGAEDRRVSSHVLNFSRLIRLREVMEAQGDGDKPIWAVEWGWNALPSDWQGDPSLWGTDLEDKQIQRLRGAVERARLEWPWLGAMLWAECQPAVPPDDPRWGFALLGREGHPRPFYYALQEMATAPPVAYPGRYPADHSTGHYAGDWRLVSGRADIGRSDGSPPSGADSLTIPFYGTGLELVTRRGNYWAWLEVTVDGAPTSALPRDEEGRSYAILYDPLGHEATIPLARGLVDGPHQARIVPHGGWGQWAIRGWVVSREEPHWARQVGRALRAAGLALLGWAAWRAKGIVSDAIPVRWVMCHSQQLALPFAALSVTWFSFPWGDDVTLVSLAVFACWAAWQPLWALGTLLFALPFYMSSDPLPDLPVASLDLLALGTAVGVSGRWLVRVLVSRSRTAGGVSYPKLQASGRVLVALVGLSLASTLTAVERAPAGAALWRAIALPALCYLLVWTLRRGRGEVWQLIDVWVVSSTAAAVIGLCQFVLGQTVQAEGVQRLAGPYSSPNHLALFLERIVPLLVAVTMNTPRLRRGQRSRHHWRNWGYGLALLPTLAALYLTYSRAAWLLALPASLLFLGLVSGGRWRRWAWMGVPLVTGIAILWARTGRPASLFDLGRGTGALRLQVWRATVEMITAHPLLGIGPGNFQFAYPRTMRPSAWIEPLLYHSHNVFLDFAAFLGLGGLVLFIALLTVFFRTSWRLLRTLPPSEERALVAGLMAGAVGALAHGLVDNGYFLPDLACLWALSLGLADRLATSLKAAHPPNCERSAVSIQVSESSG